MGQGRLVCVVGGVEGTVLTETMIAFMLQTAHDSAV
jgi:hypothetical protein